MDSKKQREVGWGCETQLTLNFTPVSTDTEALRQKCMEFWRIIDEDPDIRWITSVLHDSKVKGEVPKKEPDVKSKPEVKLESDLERRKPTAVSMIEFIKKKGLYDLVHKTKMHRRCSTICCDNSKTWSHAGKTALARELPITKSTPSIIETENMCQDLKEWDRLHTRRQL